MLGVIRLPPNVFPVLRSGAILASGLKAVFLATILVLIIEMARKW